MGAEIMTGTKNILIIEDEISSLNFMKKIVEEICTSDIQIQGCTSLQEAYEFLKNHKVMLFLVDIMLGKEESVKNSGYEFVKKIREKEEYQFVPVIFITGLEEPREGAYKELHCYGYIKKPFSVSEAQCLIKQCLAFPIKEQPHKLRLKKDGIILLIDQSDVVYIQSVRGRTSVKLKDADIMELTYMPLGDMLKEFTEEEMLLCKKGVAVNRRYVDYINLNEKRVYLTGELGKIKLGKTYITPMTHSIADIKPQKHYYK